MKKILLLFVAVACLGLFPAGAEEFVLGGCGHKIASSGYGSDAAGEISAAMYIPGSKLRSLSGNDISRLDVGFSSRINLRNVTVWVRKSLDGPNVASTVVERPAQGWNQITFAAPYRIEAGVDGLYVGYSYENSGSSHPVSFIGNGSEYTSYFRLNGGLWENMSERGALSIEAVVTGSNLPQYDLSLVAANIYPSIADAENYYVVAGSVSNLALKDVAGFSLVISKNGEVAGECHVPVTVERGATVSFSHGFSAAFTLEGEVSVAISAVDGGVDADMSNNTAMAKVSFPRNVVVEEFTTEKCPNCPEPGKWFNNVLESNPIYRDRVVPICHHSAFGTDWLTRECDTELLWLFNMDGKSFAPAAMFDRHSAFRKGLAQDKVEPIVALRSQSDFEDCIKAELNEVTHALLGISVEDERVLDEGSEIDVRVNVLVDGEFDLKDPILVFYVLENDIKALNQEGANGSYYHHHVIRDDNGSYGEPLVLDGNRFEKKFTVTVSPYWNRDNLYFAAFVANRDLSDVDNNAIENGAVLYLSDVSASVGAIGSDTHRSEVARYDIHGIKHEKEFNGLNIILYSDGTVKKIFINK